MAGKLGYAKLANEQAAKNKEKQILLAENFDSSVTALGEELECKFRVENQTERHIVYIGTTGRTQHTSFAK